MKKIIKLFSMSLIVIMMLFLAGCEMSVTDINEKYDINNEVTGKEITSEELLERLKDVAETTIENKYGEIIIQGNALNETIYMICQYDLSSEDTKDFKFYYKMESSYLVMEFFLLDEVIYSSMSMDDEVQKNKIDLKELYDEETIEEIREDLLEELEQGCEIDFTDNEIFEEIIEEIEDYLEDEENYKLKAIVDSKSNLIIDFEDYIEGRIVINKDNKIIYIGEKSSMQSTSMVFGYEKPKIEFPSTEGFIE